MKTVNSGRFINIKSVLIGSASGIAVSLMLGAIAAAIITGGSMEEGMIDTLSVIIHAIASFVSGIIAGKMNQIKRGIYAVVASVLYMIIWIGAAVLFWNGVQNNFDLSIISTMAGAALSWLLLIIPNAKNRHKYIKRFS